MKKKKNNRTVNLATNAGMVSVPANTIVQIVDMPEYRRVAYRHPILFWKKDYETKKFPRCLVTVKTDTNVFEKYLVSSSREDLERLINGPVEATVDRVQPSPSSYPFVFKTKTVRQTKNPFPKELSEKISKAMANAQNFTLAENRGGRYVIKLTYDDALSACGFGSEEPKGSSSNINICDFLFKTGFAVAKDGADISSMSRNRRGLFIRAFRTAITRILPDVQMGVSFMKKSEAKRALEAMEKDAWFLPVIPVAQESQKVTVNLNDATKGLNNDPVMTTVENTLEYDAADFMKMKPYRKSLAIFQRENRRSQFLSEEGPDIFFIHNDIKLIREILRIKGEKQFAYSNDREEIRKILMKYGRILDPDYPSLMLVCKQIADSKHTPEK